MALEAGADAVFALPVSFSCASADRFALGGVSLLNGMGVVTHQAFGCEDAADIQCLQEAANCLNDEPEAFRQALRQRLRAGVPYVRAQAEAVSDACGIPTATLARPNNILAVAYLRQLARLSSPIRPVAVQRRGDRNHPGDEASCPPSSELRRRLLADGAERVREAVPASSHAIITDCLAQGRYCAPEALTQALLYRLYTSDGTQWARYLPHSEGLEGRLRKALEQRPATQEALLERLKTRRYTRAALQRWLTRILLDLPPDDPPAPACLRLLGFRTSARPLLREIGARATLPFITKPAHGKAYLAQDALAEDLWRLGAGQPLSLYEQSPIVLPE